jgi:hypothetical protein
MDGALALGVEEFLDLLHGRLPQGKRVVSARTACLGKTGHKVYLPDVTGNDKPVPFCPPPLDLGKLLL